MITKGQWYLTKDGMGINTHKNRILPNIASVTCPAYEKLLKYTGISETIEQEIFANAELLVNAPQAKQQRDELLAACSIGLDYAESSNACAMPDCSVCKQKRENIKRIKQAIANATEER